MEKKKKIRKSNAQPLPEGLKHDMLPTYIVYYRECYNKEKQLYREFFKIEKHPKIVTNHTPLLNRNLFFRMFWQRWLLPRQIIKSNCDILFSPGGILPASISVPSVVLSQNLLPFGMEINVLKGNVDIL